MSNQPIHVQGLITDADDLLCQLAEQPEHPDRDHMVALATAHALTAIAAHLTFGSQSVENSRPTGLTIADRLQQEAHRGEQRHN